MSQESTYRLLEQYKEHALTCRQIAGLLGLSKGSVTSSLNRLIRRGEIEVVFQKANRPVYRWKE